MEFTSLMHLHAVSIVIWLFLVYFRLDYTLFPIKLVTVLVALLIAKNLFSSLTRLNSKSECYARALQGVLSCANRPAEALMRVSGGSFCLIWIIPTDWFVTKEMLTGSWKYESSFKELRKLQTIDDKLWRNSSNNLQTHVQGWRSFELLCRYS